MHFLRTSQLAERISLVRGSYEALVAPRDEKQRRFAKWAESHAPYDAVLLGWVSFTHLPDPQVRKALLTRLAELCPDGPILLSFWLRSEGRGRGAARRRLWRVAENLTARLRPEFVAPEPGDLVTHRGFVHLFTEAELTALAASANLKVDSRGARSALGTCPHVTLRHNSPP